MKKSYRIKQHLLIRSVYKEIESDLRKQKAKIKEVEKEYIENAKVIGATLSKCAIDSLIYERTFDLVVVDEVSMAYVPQIALKFASLGKRIVVCGDFYSYLNCDGKS